MKRKVLKGLSGVTACLLSISICATLLGNEYEGLVNEALGVQSGSVTTSTSDFIFKTAYTSDGVPSDEGMKALLEAEDAFNKEAMGESAVLVKNNGILPLSPDVKNISLFGRSMVDPIYRCTSAGPTIDENRVIAPVAAMESAGFSINQTLLDAYSADSTERLTGSTQSIGESDSSLYSNSVCQSFSSYGDAAIIMFSRLAGEGIDLSTSDADGVNQLSLHKQESDLLKLVKEYKDKGVFKNVIVLINSAYAMELDWLDDEEYGVDACLWIGNPGLTGFSAIPDILTGKINPSGHFVDTFAANSLSSPAAQNLGTNTFTNSHETYVVYAEGIYVGYKYYETRYEDLILGRNNAECEKGMFASTGETWNYADEITFPFGYGLSYTTFDQKLENVTYNDDHTITAVVSVTNTGNVEGKDAVQLYAQVPYTEYDVEHGVEKSAIQLLDFAKTDMLAPGESQTVKITTDEYLLASWDSMAHEGAGGYILDDGDYYFTVGEDVHDAMNNILAAKNAEGLYDEQGNEVTGKAENAVLIHKDAFDDTTYQTTEDGNLVDNKFDEGIYATDYNEFFEDKVTYLTRSDWNTFPRNYDDLTISPEMQKIHSGDFYDQLKEIVGEPETYTLEQDAGIKFIDMYGVDWSDDEKWSSFLSQLSVGELSLIVSDSWGQKALSSISKPQNYQCDGPDGGSTKYKYGDGGNNTTYVNQGTMACSWSKDLFERRGDFMAEDAFYNNTSCTMGPGVNIHRTPFSGRNHEYYSEDAAISYLLGAVQCKAMQEKGTIAMLKHICGNDQEANRKGICEFMREQSLREISLKGFEGCMREGGALSAMAAFNCLGVCNVARNYALLTEIVRGEWGWKGFIDTDANDCTDTPALCVVSGIDEFCLTSAIDKEITKLVNAGDNYLLNALMDTNKRFYYSYLQSNLVNGISSETKVESGLSWWQTALFAMDGIMGLLTLVLAGLYVGLWAAKRERFGKGGKK